MDQIIAGILEKVSDMTVFFNPTENSYQRFGTNKAPLYISWSDENRSQLVRIPLLLKKYRRMELRSPDPTTNAYLAFALIIMHVWRVCKRIDSASGNKYQFLSRGFGHAEKISKTARNIPKPLVLLQKTVVLSRTDTGFNLKSLL